MLYLFRKIRGILMMKFIAYDLGTGGVKASLYDNDFKELAKSFIEYPTYYQLGNMHEQRPEDWLNGIISSTRNLLDASAVDPSEITCLALSGHSCVAVPLDNELKPLTERVPIWSDTRAAEQVSRFFETVDEEDWYLKTGNGFPAACYSLFKLIWLKENQPDVYRKIYKTAGSKDYINARLTGKIATDHSYASSTGAYDLRDKRIDDGLIEAAGIRRDIFPEIVPSHTILGSLTREAADEIGLTERTLVACGGVDNACMALGAVGTAEGAVYTSLGSSSWIPVNSAEPILDFKTRPYVFAHIDDSMFTSAYSIFAGGSSFQWAGEVLCKDIPSDNLYAEMDRLASTAPIGSNGIFFNPSLAGGTSQDKSVNIAGAFIGLHLGNTREDMIRAVLEGIALNLRTSRELLSSKTVLSDQLLFCGGGSKSRFWMQMFADVFNMKIIKTNIDQSAASLGAAAICARAVGMIKDYSIIPDLHQIENICQPNSENHEQYDRIYRVFRHICDVIADLGDYIVQQR
jgi:xylulokinase